MTSGRVRVRQVNPAELAPSQFVNCVRQAIEEDKATALAAGFDLFLEKPVVREQLGQLLSRDEAQIKVA